MRESSRRAKYAAMAGLAVSTIFFVVSLLLGRYNGFFAVYAVSWQMLAAAMVWLGLVIQFHQRFLAEQEKLDTGDLGKISQGTSVFKTQEERTTLFAVAQKRLVTIEKWVLPVFAGIIAVYQIAIGAYLVSLVKAQTEVVGTDALPGAIFMASMAFLSFLISRYATGMSAQRSWKPLRGGGSLLLCSSVVMFLIAISLALVQFKIPTALRVVNWIIPILLIVVGIEMALNIVLDIYRPRIKGTYSRAAFDSRLLGIINEPGSVLRGAASSIDYQFGFKVSQTWFYKLLEKTVVMLVIFAVVTLYLMSCFIVIEPGEQALIEHFGSAKNGGEPYGPGLVTKWPWPIDIAYIYPANKINQINIGFEEDDDDGHAHKPMLWGTEHYHHEQRLLVATQTDASQTSRLQLPEGAVPVSLIIAAVPVQYRIKDLYSFHYNHQDPEDALRQICYRELTKFAASAKLENDDSILGAGRAAATDVLTQRIQDAADDAGLGVEVVFVGLQGVHPPLEVAADYQDVVAASQRKQSAILDAIAIRNGMLSLLAGSVETVDELYSLTEEYQKAKDSGDAAKVAVVGAKLDEAFDNASGEIFVILSKAKGSAFEKAVLAKARGDRFAGQIQAYKAAPEIFKQQQRLAMFEEALTNVRKYVIAADVGGNEVFIVDLQDQLAPNLYDIEGIGDGTEVAR